MRLAGFVILCSFFASDATVGGSSSETSALQSLIDLTQNHLLREAVSVMLPLLALFKEANCFHLDLKDLYWKNSLTILSLDTLESLSASLTVANSGRQQTLPPSKNDFYHSDASPALSAFLLLDEYGAYERCVRHSWSLNPDYFDQFCQMRQRLLYKYPK